MLGRISNYISFAVLATLVGFFRRRPDLVLAGSDPPLSVWVALVCAKGRPVVYSLQDLHPDSALAGGLIKGGLLARVWDSLHTAAMKRTKLTITLGETMATRVRSKVGDDFPITVLPGGAGPPNSRPDPHVIAEIRRGAKLTLIHAGNLGSAGAWSTLLAAARDLAPEVRTVFVGEGIAAERVRASGAELMPFFPENKLSSVMAAGDVQVITLREGMEGLVVPSKLYSILAHGRPILAIVPKSSEVAKIVEETGAGVIADPTDPRETVKVVRALLKDPLLLKGMESKSREAARRFDRGEIQKEFVRLVETVANP